MIKKLFFKKHIIFIIIAILVILLIFSLFKMFSEGQNFGTILQKPDTWNTYKNEKYGFSVEYPRGWKVAEDFSENEPKINIYKSEFKSTPPYDHFSDVSNVSIFPHGLGIEGVIGQSRESTIKFNYEIEDSLDYLTKGGDVWASYINLKQEPSEEWKDWGFIWVKNKIIEPTYTCSRNGVQINIEECNPYDGDEFERNGAVDSEIQKIQEKILSSFKVLE